MIFSTLEGSQNSSGTLAGCEFPVVVFRGSSLRDDPRLLSSTLRVRLCRPIDLTTSYLHRAILRPITTSASQEEL